MKNNRTTPLVSICCLVYNQENYLYETFNSFQNQKTNFDFEIIIHDDASTDKSRSIIESYAKKDCRIKPIFQDENKYRKGERIWSKYMFPKCKGKYIALCDGDDYWTDPNKLQKQVDFLEKNNDFNIVGHNCGVYYEPEKRFEKNHQNLNKTIFTIDDLIITNMLYTASVVFRNNLSMESFPWYQQLQFGDWALYLICTIDNKKIKIFEESMAVYRLNDAGIFSLLPHQDKLKKIILNRIIILKNLKLSLKNHLKNIHIIYKYQYQIYKLERKKKILPKNIKKLQLNIYRCKNILTLLTKSKIQF